MTIQDLLARAAELAPEWCRVLGDYYHFSKLYPGACIRPDGSVNEGSRAIILFAVLKECERRGAPHALEQVPFPDGIYYVCYPKDGEMHNALLCKDSATAALAAFVAMLEQAKEVTT